MLQQLDTVIGLAVVMLVVSLLITIITQFFSCLLGLRGSNLSDALEVMIGKIDPDMDGKVAGLAKKLADQVLTHPAVSDSVLSMAKNWPLAWKRASAIRPEELLDVLHRIAEKTAVPAGSPATVEEAAARLVDGLGKSGANALDSAAIALALDEMRKQLPALVAQKGARAIREFEAASNVTLHNLEKYFNASQDRAKQWFAMHTRIITVIAAVVVAFGLQLDFLNLFARISSDADLRARLAASAPALLQQSQNVLAQANTNALTTQSAQEKAGDLVKEFGAVNGQFSQTGLSLIAAPYPQGLNWLWPLPHLLGLFLSAAFLSLGAPFWFNTLKSLTNLRPLLAQQIDNQPGATKPPKDSSTG
jgi:hypothetical protein